MTASTPAPGEQVGTPCPACSPADEQVHVVLKFDGHATVRCTACDHVHKVTPDRTPTEDLRVVVSLGDESISTTAAVPRDETLAVGEEFVAETDDGPVGVRITSLERRNDERAEAAPAGEVRTIWTRAVDNVGVPTTIHPADGRREGTESHTLYLPGDAELVVGEQLPDPDLDATIERMLLREDAVSHDLDAVDRPGRTVPAKDVKRAYARRRGGDQWRSSWG